MFVLYRFAMVVLVLVVLRPAVPVRASAVIGERAPVFYLKTTEDMTFNLGELCGREDQLYDNRFNVILCFFITSCKPCIRSLFDIMRLTAQEEYATTRVAFVCMDRESYYLPEFKQKHKLSHPVLSDKFNIVSRIYGVQRLPSVYLIDRDGKLRSEVSGFNAELGKKLDAELKVLLAEQKKK